MQSIDLAPNARECLQQLFRHGPTWDGDIVSKAGRGELFDRGYATRSNGWTALTEAGLQLAVAAGMGDDKERWDSRRRRDDSDRHRALCSALELVGGSLVVRPQDKAVDIDISRDESGNVRFAR